MVESTTKPGMATFNDLLAREGLPPYTRSVFDLPWDAATLFFQTGVPEMDFPRSDWPANHRFVGPLLPPRTGAPAALPFADKLDRFPSTVVVSQGTVDNRDPEKLLVPALTALAGGDHLVVACTGRRHTDALRARFPHDNVVVEDWVDFDTLLPRADLFLCNGGYGSIMHALMSEVPVSRPASSKRRTTSTPASPTAAWASTSRPSARSPARSRRASQRVLGDDAIKRNVARVAAALKACRPLETMEAAIVARQPVHP